ncbi:MAG: M23 family metallopeptidase [Beijerinckiaceae bacterium]|nr:M23 family metallopeptidase [Beijerinckiaceae bacterium]
MQPVRLKSRTSQRAEETAELKPVTERRPKARSRRRWLTPVLGLLAVAGLGWGGFATWRLVEEQAIVASLRQEQELLQATYSERERAWTRRLLSAVSTQRAPQSGGGDAAPDDALADLISRQVELEARQTLLGALTAPAVEPLAPARGAQTPAPGRVTQLAPSSIFDRFDPAVTARQRGQIAALLRATEALPKQERIAILAGSLDRVAALQGRQLSLLGARYAGRVKEFQGVLAEIGLDVANLKLPSARAGTGGPFIPVSAAFKPGSFEHAVLQLGPAQAQFGRWRELAALVPLRRPLDGDDSTTSNFGPRSDPFTGATAMHSGMDFRGETGTPVYAAGTGKVLRAEVAGGYGNLVELDHGNGLTTRYAHLNAFEVKQGDIVPFGAIIGRVGSTGRSTGPHLHYETRLADKPLDPLRFIQAGQKLSR